MLSHQDLFDEISAAGWKLVGKVDRQNIQEKDVQALFNMIDIDRTGFLTVKGYNMSRFVCIYQKIGQF